MGKVLISSVNLVPKFLLINKVLVVEDVAEDVAEDVDAEVLNQQRYSGIVFLKF